MTFGWKVMLPLSLAVVFITAVGLVMADQLGAIYIWVIPVLSIVAGLFAALLVNRSLRKKVANA